MAVPHRICGFLLFLANHLAKPHLNVLRFEAGGASGATVSKSPHDLPQLLVTRGAVRYVDHANVYRNVLPWRGDLPVQRDAFGGLDSERHTTCCGGSIGCSFIPSF
jgi:hypothetical protein